MFDRRRFGRFQVAEEEYQLIRQSTGTIGWIKEMNLYGLSFEYISTDNQQVKLEDIGIVSEKNRGSFLPSLSCRVIYDINVDEESDFHSIVHFRRCGLKYRSLTKGQKIKLLSLINSVTPKIFDTVGERKG